jgi:hypothetical protein
VLVGDEAGGKATRRKGKRDLQRREETAYIEKGRKY